MAEFNVEPHMPRVEEVPDLAERFQAARRITRGEEVLMPDTPAVPGQRHIVLLTPGRMLMQQACPLPGTMPAEALAPIAALVPSNVPLNISVIALNEIPALLSNFGQAIPFAGYLMGLAYLGHNITVFEGHPTALEIGCADADLVLVDGGMIPFLQRDWLYTALTISPAQRVIVFKRNGQLREYSK